MLRPAAKSVSGLDVKTRFSPLFCDVLTENDLQNKQVLMYEGCFGFHRVANVKESKLSQRA